MKKVYIYGIIDNLKNELRYIGKSINPESRFRKHLQDSKKKISYKDKWIFSLLEKSNKPVLLIIDEVDEHNWEFWEKHYISYFKFLGCKLTNISEGGENPPSALGRKWTPEQLKRISENNKGKKRSEETKKNISLAKKGKPIPHLNNGKERSLSHKNNLSLSLMGRTSPNKGKKLSDTHKKHLSDGHSSQKKSVIQMDLNNNILRIWNSINDAQKELKIRHISECCLNKKYCKTAGGFKWKYYE
jgi:group I intron endonuclease